MRKKPETHHHQATLLEPEPVVLEWRLPDWLRLASCLTMPCNQNEVHESVVYKQSARTDLGSGWARIELKREHLLSMWKRTNNKEKEIFDLSKAELHTYTN